MSESLPDQGNLAFPFICATGAECTLYLPREGLDREDAERLKAYIEALVIERTPDD